VVIAPEYDNEAITILQEKKNRIILIQNEMELPQKQVRTCLNGLLIQERNNITDTKEDLKPLQ
jgi:phosphoribosylaminoimidazolecarboxamide formyltransferase/IMP cyclohydrolase